MRRLPTLVLLSGLFVLSGGLFGQDAKKDDPKPAKTDDPKAKKDETPAPAKLKGTLPKYYKDVGLTDGQKQEVYKIQNKYNPEIEKLDAKLKEMKSTRDKEVKGVLTDEQKKRLDDLLTGKGK